MRRAFYTFIVISVTFFITYIINFLLIFGGVESPWGDYTGLVVTFIAFIIAMIVVWIGKGAK